MSWTEGVRLTTAVPVLVDFAVVDIVVVVRDSWRAPGSAALPILCQYFGRVCTTCGGYSRIRHCSPDGFMSTEVALTLSLFLPSTRYGHVPQVCPMKWLERKISLAASREGGWLKSSQTMAPMPTCFPSLPHPRFSRAVGATFFGYSWE